MDKKRIIFIMNPISGIIKKTGIPKIIEKVLDKDSFDFSIVETRYRGHASEIAREAKEQETDIVVAVGGDGTVNEVARSIVHSDTALAILPCGSGNGLARHLMLPADIHKAVEIINTHTTHELDYGMINDHPFFCTCGMGFDAFISMKFAKACKRGPVAYLESILKESLIYKSEFYEIHDENGISGQRAFLISCANASQYGNNAYIAPQASMSDGLIDVTIIEPFDILEAPQISIDMFNKTIDKNAKVKTFRTKNIHIHREKPGFIHYDGDPVMTDADVDISVVSKGIKVIINPNADKGKRLPNVVQNVFSDLFNDISNIRTDMGKQGKHIHTISKALLKRLNNLSNFIL